MYVLLHRCGSTYELMCWSDRCWEKTLLPRSKSETGGNRRCSWKWGQQQICFLFSSHLLRTFSVFKGGKPEVIETRKSYRWSDLRTNQINRAPPALSFFSNSCLAVSQRSMPSSWTFQRQFLCLRWCDSNQGAKRLQKVCGLKFCKNKVFFTADVLQCLP